jgi:hypothetical protein
MHHIAVHLERTLREKDPHVIFRIFRSWMNTTSDSEIATLIGLLNGNAPTPHLTLPKLKKELSKQVDLPDWMIQTCSDTVGDACETLARIWPHEGPGLNSSLTDFLTLAWPNLTTPEARRDLWNRSTTPERILINRLLVGKGPRFDSSLISGLLARLWTLDPAQMEGALRQHPAPTPQHIAAWRSGTLPEICGPVPLPAQSEFPESIRLHEAARHWQAEWNPLGIRAQLHIQEGQTLLWARDPIRLLNDSVPDLIAEAETLLPGSVFDGILLPASENPEGTPLFIATDCLEVQGVDIQSMPLYARVQQMVPILGNHDPIHFRTSEPLPLARWTDLDIFLQQAGELGIPALRLRRLEDTLEEAADHILTTPRPELEAEFLYALLTGTPEYTFGENREGDTLPWARVTLQNQPDLEKKLQDYIQSHRLSKRGPVHLVQPGLSGTLSYRKRIPSTRHKAGFTLDDPRLERLEDA